VIDLVRRAQRGDEGAFEELYRQNVGRVYALCLRLCADRAQADDLTQEVFVRVWRRLDSFREESAFTSWLHRVTVNVALNAHRTDARREARVQSAGPEVLDLAGCDPVDVGDVDLERAIAALPPGARDVFVLHDVEGYRHEEIARLLGIAEGTSKAQLFRARRLLRGALER